MIQHAEHVRRRVSVAVLVVDDFTGQPIVGGGVLVRRPETGTRSIAKSDGYHVFVNCGEQPFRLEISAPRYNGAELLVDPADINPLDPVMKVRLRPARGYILPREVVCVSGKAAPHCLVRLARENDAAALKLLYDYDPKKDRDVIRLFQNGAADIDGMSFAIRTKPGSMGECFAVRCRLEEDGAYRLDAPLSRSYKKVEASIVPVYTAAADAQGRYYLPVGGADREETPFRIQAVGGRVKEVAFTAQRGREIVIDLL